jgi:hypothetical protein
MAMTINKAAILGVLTAVVLTSSTASAVTILAPGSVWEYSRDKGQSWQMGNAPFGNTIGGEFGANTFWPVSGPLQVRTSINLTGFNLSSIHWDIGVDNGFSLFANGNSVAAGNAEGFTSRWEYSGNIPAAYLHTGNNLIFVSLEDHGGLTAFDMQITGDRSRSVPDAGASSLLLGGGFLALVSMRKFAVLKN